MEEPPQEFTRGEANAPDLRGKSMVEKHLEARRLELEATCMVRRRRRRCRRVRGLSCVRSACVQWTMTSRGNRCSRAGTPAEALPARRRRDEARSAGGDELVRGRAWAPSTQVAGYHEAVPPHHAPVCAATARELGVSRAVATAQPTNRDRPRPLRRDPDTACAKLAEFLTATGKSAGAAGPTAHAGPRAAGMPSAGADSAAGFGSTAGARASDDSASSSSDGDDSGSSSGDDGGGKRGGADGDGDKKRKRHKSGSDKRERKSASKKKQDKKDKKARRRAQRYDRGVVRARRGSPRARGAAPAAAP